MRLGDTKGCRDLDEKHTPWWAIKEEREEEAKNPGPDQDDWDTIFIETSNITSGNTNKEIAFAREGAIQFLQEVGMNEGQRADMAIKAKEAKGNSLEDRRTRS